MNSAILLIAAQTAPAGPQAPGGGGLGMFVPMLLMFAVFYFMLIRPQQKKQKQHQEWLNSLKRGDDVVTQGGIIGKIVHLQDAVVTLEVGEKDAKLKLKVLRSAVSGKPPEAGEPAKEGKAAPEKSA